MKPSQALIVCEDASNGAEAADRLAALGFACRSCSPAEVGAQTSAEPAPDLVLICHCSESATQRVLATLEIEQSKSLVPTIVSDGSADDADSAVQLVPSATVSDLHLNGEVSKVLDEAERARRSGVRCDVRFRMPNSCKFIDALTTQLQKLYRQCGIDTESDHRLTTAVREMAHNAVEWGNRGLADACVRVRCTIDRSAVTIHITDSGPGFDREQLPHAATPQDPTRHLHVRDELGLRAGGFGILMTKGLVDELSYNEAGNEVRIVKYFQHAS